MTARLTWALYLAFIGTVAGWGYNPPPTDNPLRAYFRGIGILAAVLSGIGLWLGTVATVVGWVARDPRLRSEFRPLVPLLFLKLAAGFVVITVLLAAFMTAEALTGGWGPGFWPGAAGAAVGFVLGWPLGAGVARLRLVQRLGLAETRQEVSTP
jgi:hypothetical protein